MSKVFKGWDEVGRRLREYAEAQSRREREKAWLAPGQQASLCVLAERLPQNGVIVADEVGMGKTRIAVALARMVIESGGRVAILMPPGLEYQWRKELRAGEIENAPFLLRTLRDYLAAWEKEAPNDSPWFKQDIVMLSHLFCNWRLGEHTYSRRMAALLPELFAQWRVLNERRRPRGYCRPEDDFMKNERVKSIAKSIGDALKKEHRQSPWRMQMEEIFNPLDSNWLRMCKAKEYARDAQGLRDSLEKAVGLGFGCFDLVIVDEAHKGKGDDSCLSRLLEMVLQTQSGQRFSMTATPVDLDVTQWDRACWRIKIDEGKRNCIRKAAKGYKKAVTEVQEKPDLPEARQSFKDAAQVFERAMGPYLLRRSKLECKSVQFFEQGTRLPAHAYRREEKISITLEALDEHWRQAVCAAEALSVVTRQKDGGVNRIAKRVRLTVGNGHGIAALMDQIHVDQEDQHPSDFPAETESENPALSQEESKRLARVEWWMEVLNRGLDRKGVLYRHPAISAAVQTIEAFTDAGQKVLVFGRFVKPLKALVALLNAREMLRCLEKRRPWPQSGVPEDQEAVVAYACAQDGHGWDLAEVNRKLDAQYKDFKNARRRFRSGMVQAIKDGLEEVKNVDLRIQHVFEAFYAAVEREKAEGKENGSLVLMARAMFEILNEPEEMPSPTRCFAVFIQVVDALSDKDEGDLDGDGQLDKDEAMELWPTLLERLREEYDRQEGGFARLMYGGTTASSKRMIQVAFNRERSFPKVLVAQSQVGREGLNLHEACRVVLLLHPEWNPGVVEQQIGRVDRLGSRWEKEMRKAVEGKKLASDVPRIEIRPIVFEGTYDEHNWGVLRERWSNLRAQLQGVIIPESQTKGNTIQEEWAQEINAAAPNFSPLSRG